MDRVGPPIEPSPLSFIEEVFQKGRITVENVGVLAAEKLKGWRILSTSGPVDFTTPKDWAANAMLKPVAQAPMLNMFSTMNLLSPKQYLK